MRALIVDPAGNLFGSERVLLDFVDAIRTSRWAVTVCTPPGPLAKCLRARGVAVDDTFIAELHRRSRFSRARATLALLRCAARARPHVISVNQAGATRIALVVGRLLRVPVVPHVRIVEDVDYLVRLNAPARWVPSLICVSDFMRARFPADERRSVRVYDPYRPRGDWSRRDARAAALKLVCVGRIVRDKGQLLLVQALATLRARGVVARAILVGPLDEPVYARELREAIASLDLTSQVELAGLQNDVFPFIEDANALLCPSRVEPLGRVLFEAWDAGIVPIAFAGSGGAAEVINASGGGLLFADWSAESLADSIVHLAALALAERDAMVARGRCWLETELAPAHCAEQILAIWSDVSGPRRGAR